MKKFSIFPAVVLLLGGCGFFAEAEEEEDEKEFPYSYIHPSFSYYEFQYPQEWEPVSISGNVELIYRDEEMEELRYAEVPYRYRIKFGEATAETARGEEELDEYNRLQAVEEGTHRQLYYQPNDETYADFSIGQTGFQTLLQNYDGTEEWETDLGTVLVYGEDSRWALNWHKDGVYYELLVHEEAMMEAEEQVEELLARFMGEDS